MRGKDLNSGGERQKGRDRAMTGEGAPPPSAIHRAFPPPVLDPFPVEGSRPTTGWLRTLAASLLTFLALFPAAGCSSRTGELRAGFESGRYRIVAAFGDSIVEGYRQSEGWPEILGRDLAARYQGVQVINAGVSGDTAGDGLERIREDVLTHRPDLVLIAFGLNDMKNGVPLSRFESDITAIVREVRGAGATPVLLTTTRLQRGASLLARLDPGPYNEVVRRLAGERDIPMVDVNRSSKGLNSPEFLMDAAHPNAEGYRRLALVIREGLTGE